MSGRSTSAPKTQEVLRPFLRPNLLEYLFSSSEAEEARREALHKTRKTPLTMGNVPGSNRRSDPKRRVGDRCDVAAYRRAIARACEKAFPPPEDLSARPVRGEGPKEISRVEPGESLASPPVAPYRQDQAPARLRLRSGTGDPMHDP